MMGNHIIMLQQTSRDDAPQCGIVEYIGHCFVVVHQHMELNTLPQGAEWSRKDENSQRTIKFSRVRVIIIPNHHEIQFQDESGSTGSLPFMWPKDLIMQIRIPGEVLYTNPLLIQ